MKSWLRSALLFVIGAGWFSLFMPWHGFNDPDAFYHAKMGALVWAQGPVKMFPWLDLSLMGTRFADLHFLFHVLLAPLTAMFGMLNGMRVSQIIFAAIFLVVFEWCLRWMKVRSPLVWTFFLASVSPMIVRLTLGKASGLALVWFVFGMAAAWRRKPWLVGLCTFGFALSHGGWPMLFGCVALVAIGEEIYERLMKDILHAAPPHPALSFVQERVLHESKLEPPRLAKERGQGVRWGAVLASLLGGLLGLILHPNFPQTFLFAWTQVVTIGLGTPFAHVLLGSEWLPSDLWTLFLNFAPMIIVAMVGGMGMAYASRTPFEARAARRLFSATFVAGVLLMFTFKSRRMVEYLAPAIVLWCAFLWDMIDARKFWEEMKRFFGYAAAPLRTTGGIVTVGVLGLGMFVRGFVGTYFSINPAGYPDAYLHDSVSAIERRAKPGDRVMNIVWDMFPVLFAQDDKLKYTYGVDPTFLYVTNPKLSDELYGFLAHPTSTTSGEIEQAVQESGSKFVLLPKRAEFKPILETLLQATSSFELLLDDKEATTFEYRK